MLGYLIEKEFKLILRNPMVLGIIIMMPVLTMLVLPFATNQEVKNVHITIVDHDNSVTSRRLTDKILSSEYFRLESYAPTYTQAFERMEQGATDIILEIPSNLERDCRRGTPTTLFVAANAVNGTRGALGSRYLSMVISDFQFGKTTPQLQAQIAGKVPIIAAEPSFRFNPHLDYKVFMIPGLLVILVTQLATSLPALNIVGEKETGTIEQMNVSPVGKFQFILSKLIPCWVIGILALLLGTFIAWLVHGIYPHGSWVAMLSVSAIYVLALSGLGLVISNYSNTMQQAMFGIFFFSMIMMLTCGLFTPVKSMPDWAQTLTAGNPLTYYARAMRLIWLQGASLPAVLPQLAVITLMALLLNVWAIISYRKRS